ncbi:hypothetical protein [Streptomyces megasporus]|uniref:hypothetical protein n=1 Tax=Streptomyces megasporus TaxID=44060 RepID=UPI0004E252AD|nr:hypothetical protein [Streptomyces megasporus]
MSARRRIVAVWAGLCLAGVVAASALDAEPDTGPPASPTGEPTPTATDAVDCEEIADHVARSRAEAERERREALDPSADPVVRDRAFATMMVVPEECLGVLEARGLM